MIGLLLTGHGNFATGLTSSLKLIAGESENYEAVDFVQEDSVEDLAAKLNAAYDRLFQTCDAVLVLSDLAGGSPFKTAVENGLPRGNVEVVAGTNLGMLIEMNFMRAFAEDVTTLAENAVNTGKNATVRYVFEPVQQDVEPSDGI